MKTLKDSRVKYRLQFTLKLIQNITQISCLELVISQMHKHKKLGTYRKFVFLFFFLILKGNPTLAIGHKYLSWEQLFSSGS